MYFYVLRRSFFCVPADLADHHHGFCPRIAIEQLQCVHEMRADNRIAADAYCGRLTNIPLRKLIHRFVSKRARARNNPNRPLLVNARGHDSNLAMARRNNPWTIWSNQPGAAILQELPCPNHVKRRNPFCDADNQFNLCIGGFHDGVRCVRWRYEDQRAIGASSIHRFLDAVEDRPAFMCGSSLARGHAADDLCSVLRAGFGVECALAPSEALYNHSR